MDLIQLIFSLHRMNKKKSNADCLLLHTGFVNGFRHPSACSVAEYFILRSAAGTHTHTQRGPTSSAE